MDNAEKKPAKRRLIRAAQIIVVVSVIAVIAAAIAIPRMNRYQVDGEVRLSGPEAEITIVRDEKGMPYIHANSIHDAIFGHGFVTAQDRLFQIQLMRMQAQGRLCELAGEAARELDIKQRTIGIARNARKHTEILDDESRAFFQAFTDGVNAYIESCPGEIPLEFRLAGIDVETWSVADSMSILYLMSWSTSANMNHEILQQMLVDKLGSQKAAAIRPVNLNPDAPAVAAGANNRGIPAHATLGPAFAGSTKIQLLQETGALRIGSNNWAVSPSLSAGDHAMVVGDPHLDTRMLPGIMYAVGYVLPDMRAVGAGPPGIPGFIIGRNEHIATAVTNNYGDVQDLYVETLDGEQKDHYREGGKSIPFRIETETLKIKDSSAEGGFRNEEIEIRFTSRGPVVSDIVPGLAGDKLITMRWAAAESMQPELNLAGLFTAKTIDDVDAMLGSVTSIVLNFVFGDAEGNIGWRVSGRLPIRTADSGTMPYQVDAEKAWTDNWVDWVSFDQMPHRRNPDRGWVGTANHHTVVPDYPYYYSNYASPSYRYRRLKQRMAEFDGDLTVDDHWSIQRDTMNLMAAETVPILLSALSADEATTGLAAVLKEWDFHDTIDQSGPTVFQTVYAEFVKAVYRDELGDELTETMLNNWYFWQERFQQLLLEEDSSWFDDQATPDITETMADMIQRGGKAAIARMEPHLGSDPSLWLWGKVHTIQWHNPIRRSGLGMEWLGTAKFPMDGSAETLYRGMYTFSEPYDVNFSAALRMVVDFGDSEKVRAVMAGGTTARTFHPHQKDQVDAYLSGAPLHWWFSDQAIKAHTKSSLRLVPKP